MISPGISPNFTKLFQDHICPLTGIDRFSDDQILPLLLAMDPESLLDCASAPPRLYRLIRDRKVWRYLLKEVTKEQMEELRLFGRGDQWDSGSPEIIAEVVRKAAQRFSALGNFKMTIAI